MPRLPSTVTLGLKTSTLKTLIFSRQYKDEETYIDHDDHSIHMIELNMDDADNLIKELTAIRDVLRMKLAEHN